MTTTGDRDRTAHAVDADDLRAFARAVLGAVGMPAAPAGVTADAMVWADLHGLPAGGVPGRLEQCVRRVLAGGTDPRAEPTASAGGGSAVATLDGHRCWGQVGAVAAMRAALERAGRAGVGAVTVRDTGTPAALGYYPTLALEHGMIGIAITNCPALIAAPGGARRVLGNQAHAFGFPAGRHHPVLYDAALTTMSTGEMDRRRAAGLPLPDGVLRDRDGAPTTDPADWVDGFLVPIGGHRGFGLAVAFELLTSALAGAAASSAEVGHAFVHDVPQRVTTTCLALDPRCFGSLEAFTERVDRLVDTVHASVVEGGERPRLPGERGYALAAHRADAGIPLGPEQHRRLAALADELAVGLRPSPDPA